MSGHPRSLCKGKYTAVRGLCLGGGAKIASSSCGAAGRDGFAEAGQKTGRCMAAGDGFARSGRKTSPLLVGCYGFAKEERPHVTSFPRKPVLGCRCGAFAICKAVVLCHRKAREWISVCKPGLGRHMRLRFHDRICKPVATCHFESTWLAVPRAQLAFEVGGLCLKALLCIGTRKAPGLFGKGRALGAAIGTRLRGRAQ